MRVAFLGLRGFPFIQGGVETHAENLCQIIASLGHEVHVITRSPYMHIDTSKRWNGIRFHNLWSPKSKGLEAITHTFLGVMYSGLFIRPDILHIQAIGPAIMTPLARLLGMRVVVTHHGPDYDRQKWGRMAKLILQLGERFGMRCSHGRIVISQVIRRLVKDKHARDSVLIPNGVVLPTMPDTQSALAQFGLDAGRYVLLVSRFVPEKRHLDLIAAFVKARLPGWKLAIVGASDHPDAYVQEVLGKATSTSGVVCTGLQTGQALSELYGHAGIFVLPSSHEGLPIAMLEALSYGLPVVASDIPANLEVGLPEGHYFPLGNVDALANRLQSFAAIPLSSLERQERREWVASRYNWQNIAEQTIVVYKSIAKVVVASV